MTLYHVSILLSLSLPLTAEQGAHVREPATIPITLYISSPSVLAQTETQAGINAILLSDLAAAQQHLSRALQADPNALIPAAALLLTGANGPLAQSAAEQLRHIGSNKQSNQLTPQEERYLQALALILTDQSLTAAEQFSAMAQRYKADTTAQLWAIYLSYQGYNTAGQPKIEHIKGLDLARKFHMEHPNNPIGNYLLAQLEDCAPEISEQALKSAAYAADIMPDQGRAQLLYGHLLYRSQRYEEALLALERAENAFSAWQKKEDLHWRHNEGWLRSRLYRISITAQIGQKKLAAKLYTDALARLPLSKPEQLPLSSAEQLYHWEMRSLILRLSLLNNPPITERQINALLKRARSLSSQDPSTEHIPQYLGCISLALKAVEAANQKDEKTASKRIKQAQEILNNIKSSQALQMSLSAHSGLMRALVACEIAIAYAKQCSYQDSKYWESSWKSRNLPDTLLMPPLIPGMERVK